MRIFVVLMLSGALGVLGCGTDDGGSGADGGGGDGGAGGEAGMGGDGGAGGEAGMSGAGGGGGMGGAGGASPEAVTFCRDYQTICTFGGVDRYADEAACLTAFDTSGQSACYTTHLGLAATNATTHCPHATGIGECT